MRLAGPADAYEKMVAEFSKNLGVAFQILNDLKDWDGDSDNKLVAGQDVLAARPTLLLALALEGSAPAEREELLALLARTARRADAAAAVVERVRQLFDKAQVFDKAEKLVEKYRARAEAIADEIEPTELRELLYYLVDSVLDRQPPPPPEPAAAALIQLALYERPVATSSARLEDLFALFRPADDLPEYAFVPPDAVPPPYHGLLVHEHHMTVTVEAYHGDLVDVRILDRRLDGNFYSRKIVLALQGTGRVVQFGIVRVNWTIAAPPVREAIVAGQTPLGRILIQHNVLRVVEPTAFLRVQAGPGVAQWFGLKEPRPTYGRLAVIYCDGQQAIEVLEIVAPEGDS